MSTPPPVDCYRCGRPGYTNWVEVTTMADREPRYVPGQQYCVTDGCTDLDGSRRLTPLTPEQMRDRADRAWMARQKELTVRDDYRPMLNGRGRMQRWGWIQLVAIVVLVGLAVLAGC